MKPFIQPPLVDSIPLSNKTSIAVPVGVDVTVLTNTRVNFSCEVSGVPKPKITWFKTDKPLRSSEGNLLSVTIANLEDAGQYTCFAENLVGNATISSEIKALGKNL